MFVGRTSANAPCDASYFLKNGPGKGWRLRDKIVPALGAAIKFEIVRFQKTEQSFVHKNMRSTGEETASTFWGSWGGQGLREVTGGESIGRRSGGRVRNE
jgi:hypothetical protein